MHNDKVCNNLQQEGEAAAEEDSEAARERMLRVEEEMNRAAWEHGTPDYRGAASMDNILKKIDSTLNNSQSGKLTTSTALLFPTMQKLGTTVLLLFHPHAITQNNFSFRTKFTYT